MIENIINVWKSLHGFNLFPEVALFALAVYFIVRQWLKIINPRYAIYIPIIASCIGEYAYTPSFKNFQDVVMFFVLAMIQAGVAVGIYSMADKYNLPEKISSMISRRTGGADQ